MKSLLFFILTIIQFNVSAGEISKVFGNGVFNTVWGQSADDIKKVFPSAKEEHYGEITQLVVEDNRKVLGLNRDENSKISFSFDSEKN